MKFLKEKEKQRFSLRKYKAYGLSSALLGLTLVGANSVVPASGLFGSVAYAASYGETATINLSAPHINWNGSSGGVIGGGSSTSVFSNYPSSIIATYNGSRWVWDLPGLPSGYSYEGPSHFEEETAPTYMSININIEKESNGTNGSGSSGSTGGYTVSEEIPG